MGCVTSKVTAGAEPLQEENAILEKRVQEENAILEKRVSAVYTDPGSVFEAVRSGEVLLVRATWLLHRAGYVPVTVKERPHPYTSFETLALTHYEKRGEAVALPNRQQLQAEHPEAALPAEELEALHASFRCTVDEAKGALGSNSPSEDGFDALPVASASHCWYTPDHPDPEAKTLATIAAELAKLLPKLERWGVAEMGVFFDWASIYQNKPVPRDEVQQAIFKRALANMSLWYAHKLITVFIVEGQTTSPPREQRGWPTYESGMSTLIKEAEGFNEYYVKRPDDNVELFSWSKVIRVGESTTESAVQGPPIAPSRFATLLQSKTFTNKADSGVVTELYRSTMEEAFGCLTRLRYPFLRSWGEAELEELGATLSEVSCANVVEVDLSACSGLSGSLPESIGKLVALQTLNLSECSGLSALPASLGKLASLQTLNLELCKGLSALPESLGKLASLQTLNLRNCASLSALPELGDLASLRDLNLHGCSGLSGSLPEWIGKLGALRTLNLLGCSGLSALPESTGHLRSLQTLNLEACSGFSALPELGELDSLQTLILSRCSGLTSLPESIGRLTSLRELNLGHPAVGCKGLSALPDLGQLASLQTLNLECSGLSGALPDWMGSLASLQTLNLRGCKGLSALPESLGKLNSLQTLILSECTALSALPETLGQLRALQELHLSGCSRLGALPNSIGNLVSLQTITLRRCIGLSALPELGELGSLQVLILQGCSGLSALPESIGKLASLQTLNLEGCSSLTALPESIAEHTSLHLIR